MFTNTSFKYRKNHLYSVKTWRFPQQTVNTLNGSPNALTLTALKPSLFLGSSFSAFRRQLGRKTEKLFRMHIVRKPDVMVTAKPREIRMGKGKGAYSHVHLPVRVGMPLAVITWCRQLPTAVFFVNVRQATKKWGLSVRF
jgi:ribosomal protein L16/L10AE